MPSNRQRLVNQISALTECSAFLRTTLEKYETMLFNVSRELDKGEPLFGPSEDTVTPAQRQQVTEAIEAFEAARHQLRVALFAVGKEEGASISQVGRVLGISRQLASRIASEEAKTDR